MWTTVNNKNLILSLRGTSARCLRLLLSHPNSNSAQTNRYNLHRTLHNVRLVLPTNSPILQLRPQRTLSLALPTLWQPTGRPKVTPCPGRDHPMGGPREEGQEGRNSSALPPGSNVTEGQTSEGDHVFVRRGCACSMVDPFRSSIGKFPVHQHSFTSIMVMGIIPQIIIRQL